MDTFKKIVVGVTIFTLGLFVKDGFEWIKYKISPPKDQITEIQGTINELTKSINGNSEAVLELTKKALASSNGITQNQIIDISKHLQIVVNSSQLLNQQTKELNNVATIIKENEGKVAANVPYWVPIGRAIRLDKKNTFSIYQQATNVDYRASLNGGKGRMVAGDRWKYEGINERQCYVNFIGKNEGLYGVSFYCD